MPSRFLAVAGAPDPDEPRDEHLWLLIGPREFCEAGRCFYLSLSGRIKTAEDLIAARDRAVDARR